MLFLFPRAVLRAPSRAGKRKRTQIARLLSQRLHRWISEDVHELWKEASSIPLAPPDAKPDSNEKRLERAKALVHEGNLGKACAALLSNGVVEVNEAALAELQAKHPPRPEPLLSTSTNLPPAIQVTTEEVSSAINSFPRASGAGPSKLSPDHLREALKCPTPVKSERFLEAVTALVNVLAAGKVSPCIATHMCGAYLHPLAKKDGSIRPIAVGETIRRLVSKCLNTAVRREAESILAPTQLGVGVRGGCEIAIHTVRSVIDSKGDDSKTCLLKVDFKNAFNLISRQIVIDQVTKHLPGILRWTLCSLKPESHLRVNDKIILSSTGVQQGDPLGPLLFSIALKGLTDSLASHAPLLDLALFYLDDGVLVGPIEAVSEALEYLRQESEKFGLRLNLSKCEVWWPSTYSDLTIFPSAVARVDTSGIEFLGAGIGTPEFVDHLVKSRVEKATILHELIPQMDDPQCELALLRTCAGVCKVTHALRTSPPDAISASTTSFDDSVRNCLEKVCQASIDDTSWKQACLPIRDGGLGLQSASHTAAAAFVASCTESAPTVKRLHPTGNPSIPGLTDAMEHLRTHGCTKVEDVIAADSFHSLQRRLSNPITTKQRLQLLETANVRDRARLTSLAAEHAGAWLQASPLPSMGLAIPAREFRVLLRHTLGLPIYSAPRSCPVCKSSLLDVWGSHSVVCSSGGDRIGRHNAVRDALFHIAGAASLSPILETGHIIPGSQRRPGDITIPNWARGRPAAIDVTITSPLQQTTISGAAVEVGVAAHRREQAKDDQALGPCEASGVDFLPVAVETFGAWGPVGLKTISQVSQRWADRHGEPRPRALTWIHQKLSVALQRGNATMLLTRSPITD